LGKQWGRQKRNKMGATDMRYISGRRESERQQQGISTSG